MRLRNRTLEELEVGDFAELRRLLTRDDLDVFAASSGNYNPLHLAETDDRLKEAGEPVAPGMFIASLISAVLGTQLPGAGSLYRRQVLDFHERVRSGDELRCRVQVLEKRADGTVRLGTTVHRVPDDALVLSGEAEVLAPRTRIDLPNVEVPGLVVQRHRHFEALLQRARAARDADRGGLPRGWELPRGCASGGTRGAHRAGARRPRRQDPGRRRRDRRGPGRAGNHRRARA